MKKKAFIGVIVVLTLIVIGINLYMTKEKESTFQAASLIVEETGLDKPITLTDKKIGKMNRETINVTYQRKVGPPEAKVYQGISLANILKEAGATEKNTSKVGITSRDQYQIELTPEEAFQDSNAYLVMYEGEEPLKEEEGDYMLVLSKDKLSTRWVKQVVSIQWTPLADEQ